MVTLESVKAVRQLRLTCLTHVKTGQMMDFHAAFALVENLLGLQLRELARALLLRADLTRGCGGKNRCNTLFGETALLHLADATELRHIFAVHALGTIVPAARFALFASARGERVNEGRDDRSSRLTEHVCADLWP